MEKFPESSSAQVMGLTVLCLCREPKTPESDKAMHRFVHEENGVPIVLAGMKAFSEEEMLQVESCLVFLCLGCRHQEYYAAMIEAGVDDAVQAATEKFPGNTVIQSLGTAFVELAVKYQEYGKHAPATMTSTHRPLTSFYEGMNQWTCVW